MDPDFLAGYDDLGDYDMGGDELGRRARRAVVRAPASPRQMAAQMAASRRNALAARQPDNSGMAGQQILPFPNGQFTSVVTALNLPGQPQRAIQVCRLVIAELRTGATATGLIQVTQFTVGADPQFVATGAIPAAMFAPNAVGTMLKPAAARGGIIVTLSLSLTGALTAPDTITISAAGVGPSLG